MSEIKISPEALDVANTYLETLSIGETAQRLDLPVELVSNIMNKREVKSFVDNIFMEEGYNNRFKISSLMEKIITQKLEDMEETELGSNKDIADLIALQHKIRMDELAFMLKYQELEQKVSEKTNNIQINNYGANYAALMEKILGS